MVVITIDGCNILLLFQHQLYSSIYSTSHLGSDSYDPNWVRIYLSEHRSQSHYVHRLLQRYHCAVHRQLSVDEVVHNGLHLCQLVDLRCTIEAVIEPTYIPISLTEASLLMPSMVCT